MPSMAYDRPKTSSAAAGPPAVSVIRRRSSLLRVVIMLSWIVGISGSFLTVGVIGMLAADLPPIHLKTLEDLEETELPMEETSMAELMAMGESAEDSTEVEPVEPVELPETIEMPLENLDLPEIAEAMTMEDVFAIPTAPKIENALRPVDPVIKRRPDPAPSRPRVGPVARSRGTGASSTQAGAVGGSGSGAGSGKGKFPPPPYPAFARSAGMQGTVRLSISVGPSGAVESVSVVGSAGFSALDEYGASWVRRNWHWPAGTSHRYTLPLRFSLR
ncbi:energy transducer TonB [Prosthecobacter sp.]|uniref:energy transducer TonB n=1 Tax=Prosthecobacter sp. TaxID=1965333 RepID=UPI002488D993|nr:energy transducer TonB [Prosthecobacter sp.]MDI1313476.1 TonB family protein [Prosthecobacter sp.]